MKYCVKCGAEMVDDAVVCVKCGCACAPAKTYTPQVAIQPVSGENGLTSVAKIFLILSTILMGLFSFGIALAWCLPMTISYFNKIKRQKPVSIGFKVCSLLFVSMIAGILMLCDQNN